MDDLNETIKAIDRALCYGSTCDHVPVEEFDKLCEVRNTLSNIKAARQSMYAAQRMAMERPFVYKEEACE